MFNIIDDINTNLFKGLWEAVDYFGLSNQESRKTEERTKIQQKKLEERIKAKEEQEKLQAELVRQEKEAKAKYIRECGQEFTKFQLKNLKDLDEKNCVELTKSCSLFSKDSCLALSQAMKDRLVDAKEKTELLSQGISPELLEATNGLPDISNLPEWLKKTLVPIPAGEYEMGSQEGELNERPTHRVVVSAFYMMNVEPTNAMYEKIMERKSPSPSRLDGPNQPVVNISHEEAVELAKNLTKLCEGKVNFRLPTEAEWEWAARGGRNQKYAINPAAPDISLRHANYGESIGRTTEVGRYAANGFGLHDMSGNVWEWVADWYDAEYYAECQKEGVVINPAGPTGPDGGLTRVVRGGSYYYGSSFARSAYRDGLRPGGRNDHIGVRFVVAPRTS